MKMRMKSQGAVMAAALVAALVAVGSEAQTQKPAVDPNSMLKPLTEMGKQLFIDNCSACHGENGEGVVGPQLDGNGFLEDRGAVVTQILFGDSSHGMPAFVDELSDIQIAAIATYVRNAWSNHYGVVLPQSVAMRRPAADAATPAAGEAAK